MGQVRAAGSGSALGTVVAERLAQGLFSGEYRPGAFLPKETELCALFNVSRPSVRSGVQMLMARGIVSRFAGQGTLVHEYRDWNILDPLVTRWMVEYASPNPDFIREIFEFRHATEPFIAAVAAGKATARDLLAMEEAFHGMESSLESGAMACNGRSFSDYDVDFHTAIFRATRNVVWAQLAHILRPAILLLINKSNGTADELRDSLDRHRNLMECIRLRRPDEAFQAALAVMWRTAQDLGLDGQRTETVLPAPPARGPGPPPSAS